MIIYVCAYQSIEFNIHILKSLSEKIFDYLSVKDKILKILHRYMYINIYICK